MSTDTELRGKAKSGQSPLVLLKTVDASEQLEMSWWTRFIDVPLLCFMEVGGDVYERLQEKLFPWRDWLPMHLGSFARACAQNLLLC